jgi:hypothetical protein
MGFRIWRKIKIVIGTWKHAESDPSSDLMQAGATCTGLPFKHAESG